MSADDRDMIRVAGAVADGVPVDWAEAEASADTEEHHRVLAQLRVVDRVAALHRNSGGEPLAAASSEPRSWGPFELRRRIGEGRFGSVHVAWDPTLMREGALKILRESDRSAAATLEGRLLAQVRHPNVVTVYRVDQFEGRVGLWMELVEGVTLKEMLRTRGVLSAHEAALIGIDLCRAVAAVHRAGLLHRDIKAQNVMREAGGRIVLMDFGAGEERADPNDAGVLTGTPLYLAPELLGGGPASIATDLYSLGVLLYHLVTLRFPVEGRTVDAIKDAHARGQITPLFDLRPDLPVEFVRVVEKALAPDPARRYRSSGGMQQDLAAALDLALSAGALPVVSPAAPVATPSVAVLPFVNLGPDQDLEYFCSGLAEELLIALGKVPGLRVASRTSSLSIRNAGADIRTICRQLDVSTVLEGSVRKAGDQLRITAQLVSARDGCHLWSEGYSRSMTDVFAVQEEIAQGVVDRLKITLAESPRHPLVRHYTDNPRAYQFYLKGRFYWSRRYHGGLRTAMEQFHRAVVEDAGYALAYAGLADVYVFLAFYSLQVPRTAFAEAAKAVNQALAIEPDLPEARTSLALIRLGNDWNFAEADREFSRAIELDASLPLPRIYRAWLTVLRGDAATAIREARVAQDLEPLSTLVNSGVAYTFFLARRYDEAVAACQTCLEIDPNFLIAIYVMGMCRAQQGLLDDAIDLMERAVTMSDRAPFYLGLLGNFLGRRGETERVQAILDELERLSRERYVPPHCFAYLYAGLNDLDRAFEWVARAHADGASPFNYFSPVIENLHGDPRHTAELRRMGLSV